MATIVKKSKTTNYSILIIGGFLILFGVLAVYSVSIQESFSTTLTLIRKGLMDGDPSNYFYFFRHIRNLVVGIVMGAIVYKIPLNWYKKYYVLIFLVFLVFQLLVFVPGIGADFDKGASNWIRVPGLGTIQPSEFFKLGFVIFMSAWLIRKRQILTDVKGYVAFLVMVGLCLFVYLLIPDLGTIMILGLLALLMYWYSGGKKRFVLTSGLLGLLVAVIAATQFTYIKDRLSFFVGDDANNTNKAVGYQQEQALMAIGGGGVFGKGYGRGLQKFGYIPEAQSDFIFAAYSEEIGFLGNSILLAAYFLLVYYTVIKLKRIQDPYYRTFGVGLISLITIQAFVNMGVNTSILPNTGLTLPFISVGGSALMSNVVQLVLMHKIINE